VWNDDAFDNLVLPGGEKELAWDFVESKARYSEEYDDFVAEKGEHAINPMFFFVLRNGVDPDPRPGHYYSHVWPARSRQDIYRRGR